MLAYKNNANDWVYVPAKVRRAYPDLKCKTKMRREELDPYVDALNAELVEKEDEAEFRRLNAKRMKAYRDRKRTRKYSPRPSRLRVK